MTERTRDDGPRDPELSKRYRAAAQETPSPDTDRRIIDAAREAVSDAPADRRRGTSPIGIAALILLSATLVVRLSDAPREQAGDAAPGDVADRASAEVPAERAAPPKPAAAADLSRASRAALSNAEDAREAQDAQPAAAKAPPPAAPAGVAADRGVEAADLGEDADHGAPTLDDVLGAWQAGDAERARTLLRRYRDFNPGASDTALRERLPDALLQETSPGT